jgi:hypothetical protein
MRPSSLPFFQSLFVSCGIAMVVAVPLSSCAEGTGVNDIGSGAGATVGHGNPTASGPTVTASGTGGATTGMSTSTTNPASTTTSTGGSPSAASSTTSTSGSFPTAASSTTGNFPTAASSTSVTTGTSSGGPGSACDNTDCDDCQMCSQGLPTCEDLIVQCENDDGCDEILFCWECLFEGDPSELDFCISESPPSSGDLFNQWAACVVCSCSQSCAVAPGSCP